MTTTHTYDAGLDRLRQLEATEQPSTLASLADIAPDLARMAIGFVYGEIYSRPHLALKERQLVTVAALAALGNARPQLKFHLAGALQVGCGPAEIIESMVQLVIYCGFPAGLNGVFAAREVFIEQGLVFEPVPQAPTEPSRRFADGVEALGRIDGHAGEEVVAALADVAPDLGRFIIEFAFGDIYTRGNLDLLHRELVTIAALAAIGTARPQLKVHQHGFLNVGGSREQLVEAMIQLAAYAGFPAAINGVLAAEEVLAERAGHQPARHPAADGLSPG